MVTPRLLLPLGLLLAIAVGVSLRVAMRAQLDDGDRVRPLDSDSAYHLRRPASPRRTFRERCSSIRS
jgi:hypothetical protein